MKILVTGGSGLVGKYVVEELTKTHTVGVLDIRNPKTTYHQYHRVDILSLNSLLKPFKGYDAVVHLAGIPHPLNLPPEKVFQVNTLGTFNVLEACAQNGIGKLIFMSSESTLGFAFSKMRMWPEFVPITERHPLRPQDAYGLSKASCELLCAGYSRTYGLKTICLRAPWIWVPEKKEIESYKRLVAEYPKWSKNLWAYIHAYDVAAAVKLSVESKLSELHSAFFICADDNWTGKESQRLMKEFFPETKHASKTFRGKDSLISNRLARKKLGFIPRFTTADLFRL
jgi:nucleoside-diphosphate-sugar epimerase